MAKSDAVWAIDIGQCSLKALRCLPHDRPDRLVAEAFDFIEYPKILSQPGADPAELIGDALKQFLSRNTVKGDRVALAVPGQSGLARFIKLPPVESKKIPDIVRYEARQQIPFDLSDVVWDYQRMGGGSEEEGFTLETEIGLFAMKREQVFRALEPLQDAGIEVDVVQLAPLAIYNFLVFDQMPDLAPPDEYDPENPPPSVVVLNMGTDATDLIVTNGYRVWQRSIPLGGSHFTKALTKELKLTFAKAEHLKRNATAAQDPKAVFQAMRPVFNDLLTEVQRSLGFFSNLNRKAKIGKVVALGNAIKLPGLRKYLSQGLGYEVLRLESFRGLSGTQVVAAPAFKENQPSFGVCYGLAVQAFDHGLVKTNLLPKEIVQDRLIREKKPWAVAAAAALMLASTISFATWTRALATVDQKDWQRPVIEAEQVKKTADDFMAQKTAQQGEIDKTKQIGLNLVGNVEGRIVWLELLRAINECLPRDDPGKARDEDPSKRNELYIENIEAQKVERLEDWFAVVNQRGWYLAPPGQENAASGAPATLGAAPATPAPAALAPAAPPAAPPVAPATPGIPGAPVPGVPGVPGAPMPGVPGVPGAAPVEAVPVPPGGPSGPGWIVRLSGYHFHNFAEARGVSQGAQYVRDTLIKNLREGKVLLPVKLTDAEAAANQDRTEKVEMVSMEDLGIGFPVIVDPKPVEIRRYLDPKAMVEEDPMATKGPAAKPKAEGYVPGAKPGEKTLKTIELRRYPFAVEFVWRQTPPSKRAEKKEAEKKEKEAQQGQNPAAPKP